MIHRTLVYALGITMSLGALALGCESGGVGDPCTPEDEYQRGFSGYAASEVNIESRSFQCETRLCLVNHFQGRVSCPYGQTKKELDTARQLEEDGRGSEIDETAFCHIPGTSDRGHRVDVEVKPQLVKRKAADSVYCSCRCNGPDPNGRYCECPSGYTCSELLKDIGDKFGEKELAGSYCVKSGTEYDENGASRTCDRSKMECGNLDGSP